jgi:ABC-2 type transport system permease protein
MITLLRVSFLGLLRDRVALVMVFVLPVVFFSVFALILGGVGPKKGAMRSIRMVIVDLDQSPLSLGLVAKLKASSALNVFERPEASTELPVPPPYSPEAARDLVQTGKAALALIIPQGFAQDFESFAQTTALELIYDSAEPVARGVGAGLIQASVMQAAPNLLIDKGFELFEKHGGAMTQQQRDTMALAKSQGAATSSGSNVETGLVKIDEKDVRAGTTTENPSPSMIPYFAAGIGVMFLLFSMSSAATALLQEEGDGTLERLLVSGVPMTTILLGKWSRFALTGLLQVIWMFVFAAFFFQLDLWDGRRIAGFLLIAAATACAAAAFGLLLATLCRTESQLGGLSTILILLMSALGGSMVPRFVMPEFIQKTSLFTINGWALDGFLKVFWYDDGRSDFLTFASGLLPQVLVLLCLTLVFLALSRWSARRWEFLG